MTQPILSHAYDNGLVLVAEPMMSLESAAFTFMVPAGCALDPVDRLGLSSLTCEMALRGSGDRDSRQFIQDLENLGIERGESVSISHSSFSGATLAKNLLPGLGIFADLLRRPHFPDEQLEAARLVAAARTDRDRRRAGPKGDARAAPPAISRALGPVEPRPARGARSDRARRIARFLREQLSPERNDPGRGRAFRLGTTEGPGRRNCSATGNRASGREPATGLSLPKREHSHHESNQTQIGIGFDSLPYRHPDYFQAWGAIGVLSGGMSSRLFTEVREKRGLCYSVYATMHTLRDRGSVLCYAGTSAERAQETLDVTLGGTGAPGRRDPRG